MLPLFVYGSLKEGFPNHHVNRGERIPGEYQTESPFPLYLADGRLPCLLPKQGEGLHVSGQLFDVNPESLALMDELERVGQPGGYSRLTISVVRTDAGGVRATPAFVYMQSPGFLQPGGSHVGPLAEYTKEHARSLRW